MGRAVHRGCGLRIRHASRHLEAPAGAPLTEAHEHHLTVARTARYYLLGDTTAAPRELWVVLHGYGQLAGRFVRHFAPLAGEGRLVVAPEALSRFYLEHPARAGAAHTRVGATWMTRDDRDAEIADHVAYLDALCDSLFAQFDGARPPVHVLGFSQGVATATRWLTHGHTRATRLVLWSGRMPADLFPMAPDHPLRRLRLDIVTGDTDELATPAVRSEQDELLARNALQATAHRHAGGHRIDAALLRAIATATPDG